MSMEREEGWYWVNFHDGGWQCAQWEGGRWHVVDLEGIKITDEDAIAIRERIPSPRELQNAPMGYCQDGMLPLPLIEIVNRHREPSDASP